ncbi:hypothetical protein SCMU_22720 [Sinomonas cyclohexanicum]|uniref:ATP-binding protein n=1 Tax=Sinomonas cyclohexanicum TaxID=322009 RepID=A0ABM7PVX6_SINCY|nr:hypothetical protein [Corynebacterium cyclohexanicum]BCT76430.1 hypothetical protein SCMU_22720 [Corynebacterium cyclohexanicum]
MTADFGPFSVSAAQISGLGAANFGQFVGRLLATEAAAHGMAGTALETTYLENVGDGGVDAGLRHAQATPWIPAGDSAWQFKAGDLAPGKCKAEIINASKAIEVLRAGGQYRLVLGKSLTTAKIDSRHKKLIEGAAELGIDSAATRIEVVTADGLARWSEQYPALAVSPVLHGTGAIGQTFDEWSQSNRHTTLWVSSPDRDAQIAAIRDVLSTGTQPDLHLDGVSGLGKTRLVLEALRGQPYEVVVVYASAADSFPVPILNQLQSQKRTAVVVVDECDRKQHEIYASIIHSGSTIRLLTIGEPGGNTTRTPMISVSAFEDDQMKELLQKNEPQLWPEAERVVVEVAAGNIDYALKAARGLIRSGRGSAGRLATDEDIRSFITAQLPDGTLFLACCALALFSRFGHDRDVATELSTISLGLGLDVADLRAAATSLQRQGFLSKQGRFRSVGPYPLAVYLASQAWAEFGESIVTNLFPVLDPDMMERLFRRAADIGELENSSSSVVALLADDGPIASLEAIGENNNSRLLVHFAVLAPGPVSERLSALISSATEEELRHHEKVRRDLVWSLEKLAWHSRTFEVAADSLLKLAVAETEAFSNNATGTWVELFGTMLPGTAAAPDARVIYLKSVAESEDPRVRLLAAKGAARTLSIHESIMVSGEIQGGMVVERRGQPETWGDVWRYRNSAVDILGSLATDDDLDVAETAIKVLTESIHGVLEAPAVCEHLARVVSTLPDSVISQVRIEIASLRSMFARADVTDGRPQGLELFEAHLPPESAEDRLVVVASTNSWDRPVSDVSADLVAAARAVNPMDPASVILDLLSSRPVPAAYSAGHALTDIGREIADLQVQLLQLLDGPNAEALIGYLHSLVDQGDPDAFDSFVDSYELEPIRRLQLTVRGPRTERAIQRVHELVDEVPVNSAARLLFGWMRDAEEKTVARYVASWLGRLESQDDYNAAVDFAALHVYQKPQYLDVLDPLLLTLVARRADFPEVGQQQWDWGQLAGRQLDIDPSALARMLADFIETGALSAYSGSEESQLLRRSVRASGEPVWRDLMDRLEGGSWRLSFALRDWMADAVDVSVARSWVGDSEDRGRILGSVASVGGGDLSPVVRFLIDNFGDDGRVSSALVGQFVSGSWTGNESDRIARQISQVEGWLSDHSQSRTVKGWARKLVRSLEAERERALEREAEGY